MQKTPLMLKLQKRLGKPVESWLNKQYLDEWKSPQTISDEIKDKYDKGINPTTISNWLPKCGIKTRTHSETRLKGKKLPSKKRLNHLYWKEWKSTYQIAEIYKVHQGTISDLLDKDRIDKRTSYESMLKGRTKPSDEELCVLHLVEKKNFTKIGKEFDFTPSAISKWFKQIPEETKMKFTNCSLYPVFINYDEMYDCYLKEGVYHEKIEETLKTSRIMRFSGNKIFIYSPIEVSSKLQEETKQDFLQHSYNEEEGSKRISELLGDVPLEKEEENEHESFLEFSPKPRNLEESL